MNITRSNLKHYVSRKPFNANIKKTITEEEKRFFMASQWQLIWWQFRRHKIAAMAGIFLLLLYLSILFSEVIAPYDLHTRHTDYIYAPPQKVHIFHQGQLRKPFVYGLKVHLDAKALRWVYSENTDEKYAVRFFCTTEDYTGSSYKFWNLFEGSFHLICPSPGGQLFLLGTDRLGRDMLSRIIYGARISLTIGLVGVTISMILGVIIGGLAGYYGGIIDNVVQRSIEIIRSFPELPLWMALSASLPVNWSPLSVFMGITVILGLLDWPGLARAVRSRLLSLREEDFCMAAKLMGARPTRIIFRHLLPSFTSHLIASATLSIPSMILAETALSFLGLGLRAPVTSWGVILNEAQNINVIALYPWLIIPVIPVILMVLAFQFLGDGLRDASDPYK